MAHSHIIIDEVELVVIVVTVNAEIDKKVMKAKRKQMQQVCMFPAIVTVEQRLGVPVQHGTLQKISKTHYKKRSGRHLCQNVAQGDAPVNQDIESDGRTEKQDRKSTRLNSSALG